MSLTSYQKKRDFNKTGEPAGSVRKDRSKTLQFVVQKHHASHLHYDFRLEMEGVLKSWAVPKGPSLNPEDKRLAMMVEDHPFDYRTFEGTIPKGSYGAGEVIVWDEGAYEPRQASDNPEKDLLDQLKKGHITFVLHGQKLKGEFALVKRDNMEENAWLLIKKHDEYASRADVTKLTKSVISGQVLRVDRPSAEAGIGSAPKAPMPKRIKPMLATLVKEPFDDKDWIYEIKWDGYRAIGSWDGHRAGLYSRNNKDFSKKYPPVYEALQALSRRAVLDGEIVAIDEGGEPHFTWLQDYQNDPKGTLVYYVFDLLWYEGRDLRGWPLLKRQELLQELLETSGSELIRYSDHVVGKGKQFFAMAKKRQLEGMMAKHSASTYKEGYRSKQWLKVKTHLRQEVVIGGFTEPKGSRKHIGALLVGIYEDGKLRYVGHVGGGIPPEQMAPLRQELEKLEQPTSPFANEFKPNAPVHWLKPKLLCEVSFAEWTGDNHLRQPIFVGLRTDKEPQKVHQELPADRPKTIRPQSARLAKAAANSRVKITHRDKIFWPEAGYTKGDLLDYYESAANLIMPYLKNRPQSLLRQPNGWNGKSFFQKDTAGAVPDWAPTIKIYSQSNEKDVHYLVCKSFEDLQLMVQLGCIEINPWSSRVQNLDKPDWIVLDLDPEEISFNEVVKVALKAKEVCDELGIPTYPKTSGKTGLHIFIPTGARYTYGQLKYFAEILAQLVHERIPETTSVERMPAKRRHKVYIDFLQNREGQTLAAPYSVRPTIQASVSTPLHWDEVNKRLDPSNFTIKNMLQRYRKVGDIWQPVLGKGIDLKKIVGQLE